MFWNFSIQTLKHGPFLTSNQPTDLLLKPFVNRWQTILKVSLSESSWALGTLSCWMPSSMHVPPLNARSSLPFHRLTLDASMFSRSMLDTIASGNNFYRMLRRMDKQSMVGQSIMRRVGILPSNADLMQS
eukprot:Lithocolla_globosa_v1_NODE_8264_length_842_cov_12.692503.p2 type:complete len:130 gc:universal NODE_8264_length_842_cov_12.692503:300-689(+)